MALRAKRFTYEVRLERDGRVTAEGGAPLELAAEWSPDHLLLAGLARCTIESLAYHAGRAGIEVTESSADVRGVVTKRETDGRYALVEVECDLDVRLDPEPPTADRDELIAKAERDCFVGASLTVSPVYRWRVNGRDVAADA